MSGENVSVAMATYNGARFLREQLDSIAAQTRKPVELVITDDGSTDQTAAIVSAFAAGASFPVHWHTNSSRLGYRANFMRAAGLCRGDLIAFCDQDDIWHDTKLEVIGRAFAEGDDTLLVYHNARLISADREPLSIFYDVPPSGEKAPPLSLPPWHFSFGYSQVFRRSLLALAPLWPALRDTHRRDEQISHDIFFFLFAAGLGCVGYIHTPLMDYRQHAGQTVGTSGRQAPGFLERWLYRLESRASLYAYLARVAGLNAQAFSQARALLPPSFEARARDATTAWQDLTGLYHLREAANSAPDFWRRLHAFSALSRAGAYEERGFWTFGAKAKVKDAALGVAFGRLMARHGRIASAADPTCRRGALTAA